MNWLLWAFCLLVVAMFLYLSAASMLGTYIKRRSEADQRDAARMRWRDAIKDSEDTYGQQQRGDFNAVLRSRAEDAP